MGRACFLLVLLSLCVSARAQQGCPWLTLGTAEALLGEAASVTVHGSATEGDCEFLPGAAGGRVSDGTLKIVVGHQPARECATGERLKGIGEDSVFCETNREGEHYETIQGRVRSVHFLLRLQIKAVNGGSKAAFRRSLEQVAEEVAGNLF